jgi:hypothetical protein
VDNICFSEAKYITRLVVHSLFFLAPNAFFSSGVFRALGFTYAQRGVKCLNKKNGMESNEAKQKISKLHNWYVFLYGFVLICYVCNK